MLIHMYLNMFICSIGVFCCTGGKLLEDQQNVYLLRCLGPWGHPDPFCIKLSPNRIKPSDIVLKQAHTFEHNDNELFYPKLIFDDGFMGNWLGQCPQ